MAVTWGGLESLQKRIKAIPKSKIKKLSVCMSFLTAPENDPVPRNVMKW